MVFLVLLIGSSMHIVTNLPKKQLGFIGALGTAFGSGFLGAASTYLGARRQNRENRTQADINRRFQEQMSTTAHQREVADLRAAGLNPILSARHGGASTPAGATAIMSNTAESAGRVFKELSLLDDQIKNVEQDTKTKKALEKLYTSQATGHDFENVGKGILAEFYTEAEIVKIMEALKRGGVPDMLKVMFGLGKKPKGRDSKFGKNNPKYDTSTKSGSRNYKKSLQNRFEHLTD